MFGGLGVWELLVIFLIVLLFFGARRLPEIGGSLGKGIREFKDSLKDVGEDMRGELEGPEEDAEPSRKKESAGDAGADQGG